MLTGWLKRGAVLGGTLLMCACTAHRAVPSVYCRPQPIYVLTYPAGMRDVSLQRVLHDDTDGEKTSIAADKDRLVKAIESRLLNDLDRAGIPVAGATSPTGMYAGAVIGSPVDTELLPSLQANHPAQAYLRWRVTDYGETPVRWQGAYVSFEVVTTLAIAGALLVHKVTRPLAGLYVLQEGVEEIGEGYAGFWTLNRLSRPVRIEADLVDAHSGRLLWRGSVTGLAPWRWRNLWRQDKNRRISLLQASTQLATERLVDEFSTQSPSCDEEPFPIAMCSGSRLKSVMPASYAKLCSH